MRHTYPPFYCDDCQKNHDLLPGNATAWRVFLACLSELRLGPEGVAIGMRGEALWRQIDEEGAAAWESRLDTFAKLRVAESEYVKYADEERQKAIARAERKHKAERGFE